MAVRFEILERRDDTSYHYKRYDDGRFISEGYGFYTRLDPSLREAWVAGVIEWQQSRDIMTPSRKVSEAIQEVKDLLEIDDTKIPEKSPLIMPTLATVLANAADLCYDNYLQDLLKACGGNIPTPKNLIIYAFNAAIDNLKIDLQRLMYSVIDLGINSFVIPVLDAADQIVKEFFSTVDAVYDELLRACSKAYYYYKRLCTFKEQITDSERSLEWEKFREEIKRIAGELGQDILDYLYISFVYSCILELIGAVKTLGQTAADVWDTVLKKLKALYNDMGDMFTEFAGDLGRNFHIVIGALLSAAGALAGALLAIQCSNEEERLNSENTSSEADKENAEAFGMDPDSSLADLYKKIADSKSAELKQDSLIYRYAADNIYGYSLYPYSERYPAADSIASDSSADLLSDTLCRITMCPEDEATDFDSLFNMSSVKGCSRVIVEFPENIENFVRMFSEGQHIRIDDTIAEIGGVPVKSKIECRVIESSDRYFTGEYILPDSSYYSSGPESFKDYYDSLVISQAETKMQEDSPFTQLVESFNNASYVYSFIKDYISFFRFSEFASYTKEHTEGDISAISADEFIDMYQSEAERIIEDCEQQIQSAFTQDYIRPLAEQGRLIEIKDKADNIRNNMITRILELYDSNPGNLGYCSKGRIQDFMLCSRYIEYLYSDRFVYDEDNPYITELYNTLTDIISTRKSIELNPYNIDGLIDEFNELCESVLQGYWHEDMSYYEKFKELFTTGSYTPEMEVPSSGDDSNILYKKLLNYLKTLVNYTEPVQSMPEYTEGTNIEEFMQAQSNAAVDRSAVELERKLKRISYQFMSLCRIKTSPTGSANVEGYYINPEMMKPLQMWYKQNSSITQHTEGKKYMLTSSLRGKEDILDYYLKKLKETASKETAALRAIVKKCTDWYHANDSELTSGRIFEQYREIPWPVPGIIYKNYDMCDFYLFSADNDQRQTYISADSSVGIPAETTGIPGIGSAAQLSMECMPMTEYDNDTIMYWLRYCAMATLANCMMPIYWSTGLVIAGAPVPLPIVYIPFCVIPGRVITVIGIGLCGIMPSPMIIFVNTSALPGCILMPLNILVDTVIAQLNALRDMQYTAVEKSLQPLIQGFDAEINQCDRELEDLEYQISQVKLIDTDFKTNKALKKYLGKNTTKK